MPLSKYLAEWVTGEVGEQYQWPTCYFALFDAWQGEARLVCRGSAETRVGLSIDV